MLVATVASDKNVTYTTGNTYTFTITPVATVPANGKVIIVFPTEPLISSSSTCSADISGTTVTLEPPCTVATSGGV